MDDQKNTTEIEAQNDRGTSEERDRGQTCCYVVDACGCYVDPCCCAPVQACCC